MRKVSRYYLHVLQTAREAFGKLTDHRKALTFSIGVVLSIFPLVGATAILNLTAGFLLRLNHSVMQGLNLILLPLQVILMYPFYLAGQSFLFRGNETVSRISLSQIIHSDTVTGLEVLLKALAGGVLVWSLFSLLFGFLIYQTVLIIQRRNRLVARRLVKQ